MARVALGGSLGNSVEVCKGAAWYVQSPTAFFENAHWRSHHPSQAVDTSLPPPELIADSVKRSSRAHMFHLYSLLCEIASVPRKAPSAWITADRLVVSGGPAGREKETAAAVRTHHPSNRPDSGHLVSFDARGLARECLKEVGRELGVP
jgi:hypothetical protein